MALNNNNSQSLAEITPKIGFSWIYMFFFKYFLMFREKAVLFTYFLNTMFHIIITNMNKYLSLRTGSTPTVGSSRMMRSGLCSNATENDTLLFWPMLKIGEWYTSFEPTWWRLFQKRVMRTKFDIYVFIPIFLHSNWWLWQW